MLTVIALCYLSWLGIGERCLYLYETLVLFSVCCRLKVEGGMRELLKALTG